MKALAVLLLPAYLVLKVVGAVSYPLFLLLSTICDAHDDLKRILGREH